MSEPLQPTAAPPAPEALHTAAQLSQLAGEMPSVPANSEIPPEQPTWPREVIEPREATAGAASHVPAARAAGAATATVVRAAAPSDIREGGTVVRPSTGQVVRWTPIEPVADEYDAAKAMAGKGYSCLGVIGNDSHLRGSGGHTPWCTEGFAGKSCIFGKVYAIDLEAPNMSGLERWLVPQLRAGNYKWVYYLNINGHQYTRVDSFRGTYSSADFHLHLSGLAGHENDNSSILRDWEVARTAGSDDMALVPQAQWDRARAQLDQIADTVYGGQGGAYNQSVMRKDHGFQIDEVERRLKLYIDQRMDTIETKLDTLITALQRPTS